MSADEVARLADEVKHCAERYASAVAGQQSTGLVPPEVLVNRGADLYRAIDRLASMVSPASEAQAGWLMVKRDTLKHAHQQAKLAADSIAWFSNDNPGKMCGYLDDSCTAASIAMKDCAAMLASAPLPASSPVAAEGQKAVKWGYAKTVGNAIAQLQTMDPALPFYAALHLQDGRCVARGVTFSRERVVNERWIDNANKDVPYSIVVWSQPVQSLYATPTASMADALREAMKEIEFRTRPQGDMADAPVNSLANAALAATPGPRGENAGGVVEAWQPIETAPLDGTAIIGWCQHSADAYYDGDRLTAYGARAEGLSHVEDGAHVLVWGDSYEVSDGWENPSYTMPAGWELSHDCEVMANPTHWMPLPPAPDRGLRIAEKGDAS